MGTDPSDPATLFGPPAATAEPPAKKPESDGAFVKRHMPRLARARRPKAADILKELDGLTKEFGGYTLFRDDQGAAARVGRPFEGPYLSVKTDPIRLTDDNGKTWDLGEFEIVFRLGDAVRQRDVYAHLICAKALQPNPADKDENTTHPHVQGGDICFGDGETAVCNALRACRFTDAFSVVNQILHTYNSESPYAPLESWDDYDDGEGSDLDDDDDDTNYCVDCEDETGAGCNHCGASVCSGCATTCSSCDGDRDGSYFCPGCGGGAGRLVPCADCSSTRDGQNRLCRGCRYHVPGTHPPLYRCDDCNARAMTENRPHTLTPGNYRGERPENPVAYTPVPPGRPRRGTAAPAPAAPAPGDPGGQAADGGGGGLVAAAGLVDADTFGAAGPGDADPVDDPLDAIGDDRTTRGWGAPSR